MTDDALNNVATIEAGIAALGSLAFVVIYGIGSPWYKNALGVVMLLLGFELGLILTQVVTHRVFLSYPHFGAVGAGVYAIGDLVVIAFLVVFLRERRKPNSQLPFKKGKTMSTATPKPSETAAEVSFFKTARKAVGAFAVGVVGSLAAALPKALPEFGAGTFTTGEALTDLGIALGVGLAAGLAVFHLRNEDGSSATNAADDSL